MFCFFSPLPKKWERGKNQKISGDLERILLFYVLFFFSSPFFLGEGRERVI
jgi:hypothetical protein